MLTKIQFGQELEKRVLQKMPNAEIAQWVQSEYEDGFIDADFAFFQFPFISFSAYKISESPCLFVLEKNAIF